MNNTIGNNNENSSMSSRSSPDRPKPIIYTYFETIDVSNRTTGMTDAEDLDLLLFWKDRWEAEGYAPVVLTARDASLSKLLLNSNSNSKNNNNNNCVDGDDDDCFTERRYESIQSKLDALHLDDFCGVLFRRWIAMAVAGGGWFSDYDNFPLPRWSQQQQQNNEGNNRIRVLPERLPDRGKMTVHDVLSPTLASGSGSGWLQTLEALLDHAQEHCDNKNDYRDCFYTDSLAIHGIRTSTDRRLKAAAPKTTRSVAFPFDTRDPVSLDDPSLCGGKAFRSKRTVHFGPGVLQKGRHVPPRDRLPKRRLRLAREWLEKWEGLCSKNNNNNVPKTTTTRSQQLESRQE